MRGKGDREDQMMRPSTALSISRRRRMLPSVDLNVVLGEARANLHETIEAAGALVVHRELPNVVGNPEQLVAVFERLISDAIAFRCDEAPLVMIRSNRVDSKWHICVQDNGVRLRARERWRRLLHLRRAGYRETGREAVRVRQILRRHGSRIRYGDVPGGVASTFALPATRDERRASPEASVKGRDE